MEKLTNNASILYNYLANDPDRASRVYVDKNGDFQVDKRNSFIFRFRFFRWLLPLGNTSRETIDKLAIKTLKNLLDALEDGKLNANNVVVQEATPPDGLFITKQSEKGWIDKKTFGQNIGNANRFRAWIPGDNKDESELSYDQKVSSRVTVLSQMILDGKKEYLETHRDFPYLEWLTTLDNI